MNTLTSKATAIAPKTVFDRLGQLDDISHQIGKMPRDEAILRPHCLKDGRIQYQGLIRLSGSGYYYSVVFWLSSLEPPKGGIKFTPWKRVHPRTNQEPVPDARV